MLVKFKERIYPVRGSYWVAMTLAVLLPVEVVAAQIAQFDLTAISNSGLDGYMKSLLLFLEYDYGVVLVVWGILWVGVTLLALLRPNSCRRCVDFISLALICYHSLIIIWIIGLVAGGR